MGSNTARWACAIKPSLKHFVKILSLSYILFGLCVIIFWVLRWATDGCNVCVFVCLWRELGKMKTELACSPSSFPLSLRSDGPSNDFFPFAVLSTWHSISRFSPKSLSATPSLCRCTGNISVWCSGVGGGNVGWSIFFSCRDEIV